jgi:hypothetical protein
MRSARPSASRRLFSFANLQAMIAGRSVYPAVPFLYQQARIRIRVISSLLLVMESGDQSVRGRFAGRRRMKKHCLALGALSLIWVGQPAVAADLDLGPTRPSKQSRACRAARFPSSSCEDGGAACAPASARRGIGACARERARQRAAKNQDGQLGRTFHAEPTNRNGTGGIIIRLAGAYARGGFHAGRALSAPASPPGRDRSD